MPLELDERGRALENEYFHRKEKELLDKMKAKIAGEDATNLELGCPRCDGTLYETTTKASRSTSATNAPASGWTQANWRR